MSGLPRQYAKMGFKKGWSAYRAAQNNRSSSRTSRKGGTMAKKKKSYSKSRGISPMDMAIGGAVSGFALRFAPQNLNTPIMRGIAGYAAASYGSGIVRNAGLATIAAETQRFSSNFSGAAIGGSNSSSGW